jgi:hypothetical protein
MLEIIIYVISGGLALAGLILTVLNFPGIWFVYVSTLIVAIFTGFEEITPLLLIILFLVAILSTFIDNIVAALGVKKTGGSVWGMLGAILGGFVGLMIGNAVGFFLGPLVGATLFEYLFAHKNIKESLKAGMGTFLGLLLSIVLKTAINVSIIIFVISRLL